MNGKCEYCGKEFEKKMKSQKYCCGRCRMERNYEIERERTAERRAEREALKEKKQRKSEIGRINEEARKLGLSYGKYQAMRMKAGAENE